MNLMFLYCSFINIYTHLYSTGAIFHCWSSESELLNWCQREMIIFPSVPGSRGLVQASSPCVCRLCCCVQTSPCSSMSPAALDRVGSVHTDAEPVSHTQAVFSPPAETNHSAQAPSWNYHCIIQIKLSKAAYCYVQDNDNQPHIWAGDRHLISHWITNKHWRDVLSDQQE